MEWNLFKRIRKNQRLDNAEQSEIHEIGIDDVHMNTDAGSIDWGEEVPDLIKPTIKNFRLCYEKSEIVKGIVDDLVIKSISGWELEGENQEALDYIKEEMERLDLMSLMHQVATNNIVGGAMYHNVVKKNGTLYLRELAYDGENYRIKEIHDDETGAEIIGYKQRILKNHNTNKDWLKRDFFDLREDLEFVEFNFAPDEVIASHFFERNGKYKSMIENVLDEAYMLNLLLRMMPQVVFKQTNTMILQGGNKDRKEVNILKRTIYKAVNAISNYHKKGVVYLPFGLEAKMVGDTNLPKIQSYCDFLEKTIYKGLSTPPAVFDGSSSNRSTAVVQLDSDKSGRVLVQEFIQYKLDQWVQLLINILLDMRNYEKDCVNINFNPKTDLEAEDILDENGNVSTSKPNDGLNLKNIQNTERGVKVES